MCKFLKVRYVAFLIGLITVLGCTVNCYAEEPDPLTILSGDVLHNMVDVSLKSVLRFEFNHRLDHCGNNFSITGGEVKVDRWEINGTQLTVFLSETLAYDTDYTLNLEGLSDVYFEEYPYPEINFKTKKFDLVYRKFTDGAGESISAVNGMCTNFELKLINHGDEENVWMAMILLETANTRTKDIIFKKISFPKGESIISEGFKNIGENGEDYTIRVFFLSSREKLIFSREEALHSVTLPGKPDKQI